MQLLQLTADRLEKGGERDIVVIQETATGPVESSSTSDGRIREESEKGEKKTSDRLASARQILAAIE